MSGQNAAVKRCLDIGLCLILLVLSGPLILILWIAIRITSPGPAIFRQARVGKNGRQFIMLKFRTMVQNAPDLRNPDNSTFNSDDDPRLTSIGRVLRRTSLDELPQLINVIHGEMSMVGPRPELPEGPSSYLPHQFARLAVRPGITGWAAVNGRNNVPMHIRRNMDAWYAENWSFSLDVRILWQTLRIVLHREGINATTETPANSVVTK